MPISPSEEKYFPFQHSTHIAHEMDIVDRNLPQKSRQREIAGVGHAVRMHELDFNTVIYIV